MTTIALLGILFSQYSHAENIFFCDASGKSTSVKSKTGTFSIFHWANRDFDSSITAEQRCQYASAKLQKLYDRGRLKYIKEDIVNNLPVICNAPQMDESCLQSEIIATLKPNANGNNVLLKTIDRRVYFVGVNPLILYSPDEPKQFVFKINQKIYFDIESLFREVRLQ